MVPERISRVLSAYVDGELDARQCKAVARLLRRSSEARALLRGLQKDAELLHSLPQQTLAPDFSEQVLRTIASREAESARRAALTVRSRVPPWLGLVSAAAAVLLVVGLRSYLATLDRQERDGLVAVRIPWPAAQEVAEAEITSSTVPKASERELLPSPVPEIEPKTFSAPEIASTEDGKPESKSKPPTLLLGSPLTNNNKPLNDPEERVVLICNLWDLDQAKGKQLERELQKWAAHAMDLRCTNPVAGMERLQTAFKSQGIQFSIDTDAQAVLKLSMEKNASFALYFEDITAEEIVTVLQQLQSGDAERKRTGAGRFEGLIVNAMRREDEQKLWGLFRVDPAPVNARMPRQSVDFREPLSSTQGKTSRSESAKTGLKTPDRRAMVVAYTPGRLRPVSTELKRFLDNRRERRPGALQIVLVLNSTKS